VHSLQTKSFCYIFAFEQSKGNAAKSRSVKLEEMWEIACVRDYCQRGRKCGNAEFFRRRERACSMRLANQTQNKILKVFWGYTRIKSARGESGFSECFLIRVPAEGLWFSAWLKIRDRQL
jgi:hypothetical protein